MNIIIPNYEILNFEAESLVISDVGVSKVHSKPLLEVLRKLRLSRSVTREELDSMLMENGLSQNKDAFEFLERIAALKTVGEFFFEKTIVVHDWQGQVDIEKLLESELLNGVEFRSFSDDTAESVRGVNCFVVLLCHSYDYESLKALYFNVARASPKSAISVYWPMGGIFCIGQPYVAEIGNPCHFCCVDRLINNDLKVPAKNNWANVLAFCRNQHVGIPAKPLSLYQEMIVIGAIIRSIRFFTEHGEGRKYQDNVLYGSYLQLVDGSVFEEPSVHWYMCDCLRAGG